MNNISVKNFLLSVGLSTYCVMFTNTVNANNDSVLNKIQTNEVSQPLKINSWTIEPQRLNLVKSLIVTPDVSQKVEVPFALLSDRNIAGRIEFNMSTNLVTLNLDNGQALSFSRAGIPVFLSEYADNQYIVIFRDIPSNALRFVDWNANNNKINDFKIERQGVDYLMFRVALYENDKLSLVVYDNHTEKNYIRQYRKQGGNWMLATKDIALPTLDDPAGSHYEMQPPISLFWENDQLNIVGGNLNLLLDEHGVSEQRIDDCERVLEAINSPQGIYVLCNGKNKYNNVVYNIKHLNSGIKYLIPITNGIPWKLSWNLQKQKAEYQLAQDINSYRDMLIYDIERGQNAGTLELGSNNIEGRVAWSQLYYLNGLLDIIELSQKDDMAFELFSPILDKIRLRVEIETRFIDNLLYKSTGMYTKGFTFDRSPALFAVQTSRALLFFNRYNKLFPDAGPLKSKNDLQEQVLNLTGHMEVLATSGEKESWISKGQSHLRWPKGNAFYFDGLGVPYNHQNEWAYSIFDSYRQQALSYSSNKVQPQREIINHFMKHLSNNGKFPDVDGWFYWWGHAYDGYNHEDGFSIHTPDYKGDKSLAWISFRTIDLMSVISGLDFINELDANKLLGSADILIKKGKVYPFAARSLLDNGYKPSLNPLTAHYYSRSGSPWELANQPWALVMQPDVYDNTYQNDSVQSLPDINLVLGKSLVFSETIFNFIKGITSKVDTMN